jgi:serine protease Do
MMHLLTKKSRPGIVGLATALVFSGAIAFSAMGPVSAADLSDSRATVRALSDTFADVTEQVSPAVVFVTVEKEMTQSPAGMDWEGDPNDVPEFFRRFLEPGQRQRVVPRGEPNAPHMRVPFGQGAGFLISSDGYIVTNNHVVGDADIVKVVLKDGRKFDAKTIGSDPETEIALIKVDAENLPTLKLADSDKIRVGEWVLAIGSPFGLEQSVTSGIVSATGRSGYLGPKDFYANFIQTDAAINPGNSGGPLLNMEGEVIGMNTMIVSSSGGSNGIGLAIPTNMIRNITDQLRRDGKITRGFLGVGIQNLTPELAPWFGNKLPGNVLISEVTPDSPGERAGLKRDDVIVEFDGQAVRDAGSFRSRVSTTQAGKTVKMGIIRDGQRVDVDVTVGEKASTMVAKAEREEAEQGTGKLGFVLKNLTDDVASQLGYESDKGVLVAQVAPGSPAAQAMIEPGQLITEVNHHEVHNTGEFAEALKESKDGKTLLRIKDSESKLSRYVALEAA